MALKKDPADLYTEELLAKQEESAAQNKGSNRLLIILSLVFLFGFAIAGWILPDRSFSEEENRVLKEFPKLTSPGGTFADRLIDGSFTADISEYFADQFPLRDLFVGVKAGVATAFGQRENNGVLVSSDGTLVPRSAEIDPDALRGNFETLRDFGGFCEEQGIPFTLSAAPRKEDLLTGTLHAPTPDSYTDLIRGALANSGIDTLDYYESFRGLLGNGMQLYYRTDHHWTTPCAYAAYRLLAGKLGEEPYPEDAFSVERVSDSFYGTTWSSAGMKWVGPDEMYYYRYEGDDRFYLIRDGREERGSFGLYDESYLAKKDKYASFLSGNTGRIQIRLANGDGTPVGGRKTLLIVKDSFANAQIPFLARHFDLEVIDLRYYKASVRELVRTERPDAVIGIYNYDSLIGADTFKLLTLDE